MCGFAEAGLVLSAIGTVAQISQTNKAAKEEAAEYKRQAENKIIENTIAKDDHKRRVSALQDEALAVFGASGFAPEGGGTTHVSKISGELGRDLYTADFNTNNAVQSLSASIKNVGTSAAAKNTASLFSFAEKGIKAGEVISTRKK